GPMKFPVLDRRRFFTWAGVFGTLGSRFGSHRLLAAPPTSIYTSLGLRPIINASGTYTHLGGSLMPPEVLNAMNEAARQYVPIRDLTKAVGDRIARLTGNDGALVTTGAAGAIFVGTCACI